jgi:hypothetical protein
MEVIQTIFLFRGIERLLIQAGAITSIVLGVFLYKWGIQGSTELDGESVGFKFKLKNAAPGSVLALFGMAIMIAGISTQASVSQPVIDQSLQPGAPGGGSSGNQPPKTDPKDDAAGATSDPPAPPAKPLTPPSSKPEIRIAYGKDSPPVKNFLGQLQGLNPQKVEDPSSKVTELAGAASKLAGQTVASPQVQKLITDVSAAQATDAESARKSLEDWSQRAGPLLK